MEARVDGPGQGQRIPASSWYALAVLSTISLFSYMDRTALSILLEPIKKELGLTNSQLGLLTGIAFALLYATMGVPLARVADRSSRIRLIGICFAGWSAMTVLCGFARNFTELFVARLGVGVGEAGCFPASHSIIADKFPKERRAFAIGIFQGGSSVGIAFGLFLVGFLGDRLGWRAALEAIGLAGLPVLLLLLTLKEPARPEGRKDVVEPFFTATKALLRRPSLVYLMVGYAFAIMANNGLSTWVPTFMVRSFGLSLSKIGGWYGASYAFSVLGLLVGGVVISRLMRRDPRWEFWVAAGTYAISLPLYVAMVLAPTWWMVIALQCVGTFFSSVGSGATLSGVQSLAEPRRRATAASLVLLTSSLVGAGMGPWVVGMITDALVPELGKEALRYAMLVAPAMFVPAVVFYVLVGLRSTADRVS